MISEAKPGWHFTYTEKCWFAALLVIFLAFGCVLEHRTALRRSPMTDLGVFCIASGAIWSGSNPYDVPDWHGWHYQYPPALAILFFPFAEPVPLTLPPLAPGAKRSIADTPWGYHVPGAKNNYGLHAVNLHFFVSVAVWYVFSVLGVLLSSHLLACILEQKNWREPPPVEASGRRRWWLRRTIPLLICATSLGTDLSRGQADILMLVAISVGVYLASRRKDFQAGLFLAIPAAIKLFPPLLLTYPFLRRQWRMTAGVIAGLLILLLGLPVATLGIQRTRDLYQCWIEVLAKPALGQGSDTSRLSELTGLGSTDNQSILSVIHNWKYFNLKPALRPVVATTTERGLASAIGVGIALVVFIFIGFRRNDPPHRLLVVTGLLVAVGLLINPIIHNFYFLLLLPLVSALFDFSQSQREKGLPYKIFLIPLICFLLADVLTRLPGIGHQLRDRGLATMSLVWLTIAGVIFLQRQKALQS